MKYDVIERKSWTDELVVVMTDVTEEAARHYIQWHREYSLYVRVTGTTELLVMTAHDIHRANFQPE